MVCRTTSGFSECWPTGASIPDADYKEAGATVSADAGKAAKGADIVLKVRGPLDDDENELEDLENEVCSLMKEGYEPLGGLSVRAGGIRGANFMQAMLRTTK